MDINVPLPLIGPRHEIVASKVVPNHLKFILPKIVSEQQSTFVLGRLITDNIIYAYECLHFVKRNKARKTDFVLSSLI